MGLSPLWRGLWSGLWRALWRGLWWEPVLDIDFVLFGFRAFHKMGLQFESQTWDLDPPYIQNNKETDKGKHQKKSRFKILGSWKGLVVMDTYTFEGMGMPTDSPYV